MATPIIMPRQGQSVESCILTEWKVNLGDEVAEGDVLAVIETDKASFDLESTAAGKVPPFSGKRTMMSGFWPMSRLSDRTERMWRNFVRKGREGASSEAAAPSEAPSASPVAAQPSAPVVSSEVPAATNGTFAASSGVSPRARRLAIKHGLDPESVQGSGPDGRVIERDIQAALDGRPRLSATARSRSLNEDLEVPVRGSGLGGMVLSKDLKVPGSVEGAEVTQVKGIRKVIAERMIESLSSTAQLTLHASFELDPCPSLPQGTVGCGPVQSIAQ